MHIKHGGSWLHQLTKLFNLQRRKSRTISEIARLCGCVRVFEDVYLCVDNYSIIMRRLVFIDLCIFINISNQISKKNNNGVGGDINGKNTDNDNYVGGDDNDDDLH